jgi:hypothetical protein
MGFYRVLALAAVLVAASAYPAAAQFGAMPGMPGMYGVPGMPGAPGSPGMPGTVPGSPAGPGFGGPPAGPPPGCQQLLQVRDEYQKNGSAISSASKAKAEPAEACKLFKTFLASESKMIQSMEQHKEECGVPAEAIKNIRDGHAKASQVGKQVCEMAAQGPRAVGPSLSDALNSSPTLPETNSSAPNHGTYDTLTGGNALVR